MKHPWPRIGSPTLGTISFQITKPPWFCPSLPPEKTCFIVSQTNYSSGKARLNLIISDLLLIISRSSNGGKIL